MIDIDKIARDHWDYIKDLLETHGCFEGLSELEFHYITAFKHGYKHGLYDKEIKEKEK